jgi:hypothetical protein
VNTVLIGIVNGFLKYRLQFTQILFTRNELLIFPAAERVASCVCMKQHKMVATSLCRTDSDVVNTIDIVKVG